MIKILGSNAKRKQTKALQMNMQANGLDEFVVVRANFSTKS